MEPLTPQARDALAAYRRERGLSREHHEQLLDELAARLVPAAPSEPPEVSSAANAGRGVLAPVALGSLGVLLLVAVATLLVSDGKPPPAKVTDPAVPAVSVVVPPVALPAPAPLSEQTEIRPAEASAPKVAKRPLPRPRLRIRQSASVISEQAMPSPGEEPLRAPVGATSELAAPARTSVVQAALDSSPAPEASERLSRTTTVDSSKQARRAPEPEASLDEEVLSLRRAHQLAKQGEPLRALTALGEHARRFPAGKLSETAQVARLSVLCDLGRIEAASAVASQFLLRYPASLYAARVRRVCTAD